MVKWKKPSGKTIETNEEKATIEAALDHGWKLVKPTISPEEKKMNALIKKATKLGLEVEEGADAETIQALIDAAKK